MTRITSVILLATSLAVFSGCKNNEESAPVDNGISLNLNLPNSLTGGKTGATAATFAIGAATAVSQSGADIPCAYIGSDHENPFDNGYEMTKFMLQVIATWSCVADTMIDIVNNPAIPHNGQIVETDNVFGSATYDPEDPTHYSVTQDNSSQTSLRLYYGYDRSTPPTDSNMPGIYLSWDGLEDDDVQGKLIIDIDGLTPPPSRDPTDPVRMRMDFKHTQLARDATMYLEFDSNNPFANGFRIDVSKDLTALASEHVYTARGLIDVKAQFLPVDGITELPQLRMYTVSDRFGEGAAIAQMSDVSLPFVLDAATDNSLGNYLFSKTDQYYFDADQQTAEPWDYINKEITSAEYRGGRTTQEDTGTPTLVDIRNFLGLSDTYFTGAECGDLNSDCTVMLNAVFQLGFAEHEMNQGQVPNDWREPAIAAAEYLQQVYPDGQSDWSIAFDMSFTPAP